ncbi:cilia- and flagella-associated protein 61 isoform X1 [Scyliorhinus canicula]|uniref:cilia- and flagella-associated protein 61 isoform X1 n=2 Tax=Scyliorhinus canicula TaxID=7830 RepID=UPI0018F52C3D|nr:cilia- and flagella-associated protein 61 isoform X1 [Scyliorhinus canicula]
MVTTWRPTMTTIYASGGGSQVINVRRSESQDALQIMKLFTPNTTAMFGRINVIYLLERANLSVTVENEKNEVMAHAALLDYPNVEEIEQNNWEPWLHTYGPSSKCTPLNTLFMHLLVAKPEVAGGCAKEIVRSVFNAIRELHFIILAVRKKVALDPAVSVLFAPMPQFRKVEGVNCSAFICYRKDYVPVLHIRQARIEDHDDVTPIFNEQTDTLRYIYGEYFLAELIEAQDETTHAAVSEVNNTAVGFISVCSEVNVDLLNECYDLRPFHGLRKGPDVEPTEQQSEATLPSAPSSPQDNADRKTDVTDSIENAKLPADGAEDQTTEEAGSKKEITSKDSESSNSFCIQLFCIDEKYESRSQDFLPFIFNLYPDKDFCVITVPHLIPEFPLLKDFIRVVPYSKTTLSHELYVTHRKGLLKFFVVRLATQNDTEGIQRLVKTLNLHLSILNTVHLYNQARRDSDGTPIQVIVAEVLQEIVGIAITRNEENIEYIRSHYDIESFIYFNHHQREEHGHLYHFALNPIFHHHTRHFLKEILRITFKSCLYYPVYPKLLTDQGSSPFAHSLTSALNYLVPVRRRRQIIYPLVQLDINAPSKRITRDMPKYALSHMNRKLSLESKVTINSRIVVVGASEVGISFLETLVFCPHLRFNNITLISTCGLPGHHSSSTHRKFKASSHGYSHADYAQMSLQTWVNVVTGKMIGIDRAAKHVLVTGDTKVPYEHLILCTGEQYQVPCPTGVDIKEMLTNEDVTVDPDQQFMGKVPSNLFVLNTDTDCENALHWLRKQDTLTYGNIIVYGNTADAYITVNTILSFGIDGSFVKLVKPPSNSISCFNNSVIDTAVDEALRRANVSVHSNCLLAQWNDGNVHDRIILSTFTTNSQPLSLKCSAFFNFHKKKVDLDAFKAINKACLVFDGKLVIDSTFHTNDMTIRAAGSLTKYSRRYYADQWSHENFNAKEIGFQLAALMLHLFDPTLEQVTKPPAELDKLLPTYIGCKVKACVLPGQYHYLHISKPGIVTCLEMQKSRPEYGREIITGSPETGNYFEIHLNQYNMVESITCLSLNPLPVSNYICLYGQHERLLNNLCSRFDECLISDLYRYLEEPWCMCIYHDRFMDFKGEVRQIVESNRANVAEPIEELIRQIAEGESLVPGNTKTFLEEQFRKDGYQRLIERSQLNYLSYNRYHLPMFAWPGIV